MRISYPDYIKLLREDYDKKRTNNGLSLFLAQSAPAKIRQACLHVYQERFDKKDQQLLRKDEQLLRDFFGPAEHGRQFLQLIRDFEVDRFRPLDNYLKKNTENTDKKNVELLAWLIDFKHRPYVFDKDFILSDEEIVLITDDGLNKPVVKPRENNLKIEEDDTESTFEKPLNEQHGELYKQPYVPKPEIPDTNSEKKKSKQALIIILILVCCSAVIYAVWKSIGNSNTVCAYWADDRYQEVPCNEDPRGRLILTMNREKVQSFRKIMRKDTMTEWSIGKAYYIQNSDTIACYTEGGKYPENLNRNLRVLTRLMFNKHLGNKPIPGKDSLDKPETKPTNNR